MPLIRHGRAAVAGQQRSPHYYGDTGHFRQARLDVDSAFGDAQARYRLLPTWLYAHTGRQARRVGDGVTAQVQRLKA